MAILPMIFLILVKPNRGNEVISTSQGRNVDFARVQMNTRKFRSVGMKRGGYGKAVVLLILLATNSALSYLRKSGISGL